jgi:FemAB-related protein (PEP-CTERM system-associated)
MNAFSPVAGVIIRTVELAPNRDRIDAYVVAQAGAQPFHRPQWSEAVERGCGQRAYYLLAERPSKKIAGVLPLTEIRSSLFGTALVSAGFAVGGGPLAEDDTVAEALAKAAWNLAGQLGCPSIEMRGGRVPLSWKRCEGVYAGFVRALPAGDEAILTAIPRKQRAEVRRAQGFGLDVSQGSAAADRDAHYAVYAESVRNLGTPVFPRELFDAMLDGFGEDADIVTVWKDGAPVSSVLSFYLNGTVYPYWGGGTRAARALRANELAYYELMRRAAARGCDRFDFGRSKLGTGAYAFKKNWGFEPQPLVYSMRTAAGMTPREINPLSPKYRLKVAAWQRLPLWVANRLGPRIARGLG